MAASRSADILLVEDSPADAELALRVLRQHNLAGDVAWVRDGAEALDFIHRRGRYADRPAGCPRLILLDIKMPKVDGIEVLRQLKSDDETKTIPVVILTSSAEESDVVKSYRFGVNSYLVKPVGFEHFRETVEKAGFYWLVMNRTPEK